MTDGNEAVVFTARRLRAARQCTVKHVAELQAKLAGKHRDSRRWKQLQARKQCFLTQQQKRTRAIAVAKQCVCWRAHIR